MRPSRLPALVLLLAIPGLMVGCGDKEGTTPPPASTTGTTDADVSSAAPGRTPDAVSGGPKAGAGVAISPEDRGAWCGAVTPKQLTAATGFEVENVMTMGAGVFTCRAEVPGLELQLAWGTEPTDQTFEDYAAGRAGDVEQLTLPSGQPAVAITVEKERSATVGTVVDGQLFEAELVAARAGQSVTVEDLTDVAAAVVAVYQP